MLYPLASAALPSRPQSRWGSSLISEGIARPAARCRPVVCNATPAKMMVITGSVQATQSTPSRPTWQCEAARGERIKIEFIDLWFPHTSSHSSGGPGGGLIAVRARSCVKMELVDTTSGGRDWFSPSVVVVLTAPHPGGADKKMRTKETSRRVDCISRPGIGAEWFFLGI